MTYQGLCFSGRAVHAMILSTTQTSTDLSLCLSKQTCVMQVFLLDLMGCGNVLVKYDHPSQESRKVKTITKECQ